MHAPPEERLSEPVKESPKSVLPLIIGGAVLVIAGLLVWLLLPDSAPEPAAAQAPVVAAPVLPVAPDIPMVEAPVETPETLPEEEPAITVPPPAPEELNAKLSEAVIAAADSPLFSQLLQSTGLAERATALIDALSNGTVLRKLLPLTPPKGKFPVVEQNGTIVLSPTGYARYDKIAEAVSRLDAQALAAAFHRYRAHLEGAYAALGLPAEDFDNVLIRALDQILLTPEISEEIVLEQKSVMYTYADPRLEALDDVQKQLLRMGPENIRKIKAKAREVRGALLQPAPE